MLSVLLTKNPSQRMTVQRNSKHLSSVSENRYPIIPANVCVVITITMYCLTRYHIVSHLLLNSLDLFLQFTCRLPGYIHTFSYGMMQEESTVCFVFLHQASPNLFHSGPDTTVGRPNAGRLHILLNTLCSV